ncbi:DUF885 domain-containing protein [Parahaliea mediterranea]|uniref:DUF885 domain-containing protein n=1 Tax=Parahaliea mediterranea TaxID=651086 RepID=UPI001F4EE167|nr:DUF885 family protein [Parahaliea mediterranea]
MHTLSRLTLALALGALPLTLTAPAALAQPAAAAKSEQPTADARLQALYEREYAWRQDRLGKVLDEDGEWQAGSRWAKVDPATQRENLAYWEQVLAELDAIPADQLSHAEQINADTFRQIVTTLADEVRFKTYEAPLNSDSFFWTGLFPRMGGFEDADAYRRYIDRLRDMPRFFEENVNNMRAGLKRGYSVPRVTLAGREKSLEAYLATGEGNPFWTPLADMPQGITGSERQALERDARAAINEAVVPAYTQVLDFMRDEYLKQARTSLAVRDLPDGEAFYQAQIRAYTTLDLSPEEIHQRGLDEVARIEAEMQAVIAKTGFDGDLQAFIAFLRTDPQFYAKTPRELLSYSAYVAKKADGYMGEVLGFLPRRRFTILPVPDAIAPFYTSGRGGLNSCLMNTYDLPSRPLFNLPALTLHECAPGHALQAAIAKEAPGDIPRFRRDNYFSGYGEGWGLYTEWLGTKMGVYETPYEDFGRLSYEMWRACRLVIDTGVHYMGWSRERALAFLGERTALSTHEVTTEVDRYISWPGQALAYKLGEMLIRRKRAEAEDALGADFDQRYFHDVILGLRSVPLPVLEAELDRWIAGGGGNPYADEAQ